MTKKHRKFTQLLDEYLKDEQFAADFLSQALEEEDFSTFLLSLKDIIRVHGSVKSVAEKAHISRSTIYNLFSENSNPELKTILTLLHAIGYELRVTKKTEAAA
ncbi:MAG: putative addiction module antidote protein [Parachlamydiaceae bacterium]|nr:putative addiction module antidote protein [Parachlamydiaceae bacterium]